MSLAKRVRSRVYKFLTLKKRIIILFFTVSLVIFSCTAAVSYFAISSILHNKLEAGIKSNLKQIKLSLQNTISNLNHVSQQLALQGSVGIKLDQFLATSQPYEKSKILDDMQTELNLITFTNPGIGLVAYYFGDDKAYFLENSPVKDSFSFEQLPLLAEYYGITYFGPHVSGDRFNNQFVLSALRKVDLPDRNDVYVYIESGFKLTQSLLDSERTNIKSFHIMLDNDGRIAYSENAEVFPVNGLFPEASSRKETGLLDDYYWYKDTSNQGWSIVSVIPKAEFNKERDLWINQMTLLLVVFLILSSFLALLLWKMLYRPLNIFNREMKWIEEENFRASAAMTKIPEFDRLLDRFQQMKRKIIELFKEVEYKEKRRADLEIEKLRYQINPHFLMNTLNSVHWMAVTNNQPDIDQVALALNRLLYYNLGKKGPTATIQEEIDALKEYLVLQQIRHEFQFTVCIHADEEVLKVQVPRFILQPLVENAIYHGLGDNGSILVEVKNTDVIEISIHDNGAGMSEETVRKLLEKEHVEHEKVGMGIGLNYVKRMLESYYGGKAEIKIVSAPGQGTSISLLLPQTGGGTV